MIVYQPTSITNVDEPIRAKLNQDDIETLVGGQPLELHVVFSGVMHTVTIQAPHCCNELSPCGNCLDQLQTEMLTRDSHALRCQPGNECERCRAEIERDMEHATETDPSYGGGL